MKGILKCLSFGALFVLSLTVSSQLFFTDAKAVSPFDNTVRTVNKLELKQSASAYCADEKESWDLTNNWADLFNRGMEATTNDGLHFRYNNGFSQNLYDNYMNAWNNKAYWGVSISKVNSTQSNMMVWWTEDAETNGVFDGPYGAYTVLNANAQFEPVYFMTVVLDTGYGCDASILPGFSNVSNAPTSLGISYNAGTEVGDYIYFAYLKSITYPSGYEGVVVPDTAPVQPGQNDSQPDIYMTSMSDFKGEFSDRNFFTFDGIPFTCGEFVPQINVEIFKRTGTEEKLTELSTSASTQFSYQFPVATETRDYRIVSYYSCPELVFSKVAFYDFQINSTGGLVNPIPCNAELFCSLNLPTYGLTQAILSPLAFVAQIPSNTCSPLVLPMPHGMSNINLPCMTPIYQQYFGPILLLFQTIMTGLFAYYISLRLFGNVKQITNPRDDQVETVKL